MKSGNKSGITLPETLIASLVLGITLSGIYSGFVMCRKSITYAGNALVAMHNARSFLETLTAEKYSSSSLSSGAHSLSNGSYVVSESDGVKKIALTVSWVDPARSATSSVTLTTSISSAVHQ